MKEKKFNYADKLSTAIFSEDASENNPYIAERSRIHGYDITELASKKSFVDVLLLLFTGELPNQQTSATLNQLMVGLINLGPRDDATRAAMVAGVGKANHEHILPIGLNILGGENTGSKAVENCVKFIKTNEHQNIFELARNYQFDAKNTSAIPGLGSYYGGKYLLIEELLENLLSGSHQLPSLRWLRDLAGVINKPDVGVLPTGLAASVLLDLGFGAREAAGVYQIIRAPGILAQGLEQTHKPITAMPLLEDEKYELKS